MQEGPDYRQELDAAVARAFELARAHGAQVERRKALRAAAKYVLCALVAAGLALEPFGRPLTVALAVVCAILAVRESAKFCRLR